MQGTRRGHGHSHGHGHGHGHGRGHGHAGGGPPLAALHGRSYDAVAAIIFGGRRQKVFRRLAVLSGARSGDRVLDVGCGTGYFTRIMARTVQPEGAAFGIDPSGEVLAQARRAAARTPGCTFAEGRAEALDAGDGSYDVVVTSLMIHHLPGEQRSTAIGEMFRVLRPGGRVLIAEFRPPRNHLGRAMVGHATSGAMGHNPVHLLEPMLRDAGFQQLNSGDIRPWIRYVQAVKPL